MTETAVNTEVAPEPTLVHWSSNYKHRLEVGASGINDYEEIAIFDNPDGSQTTNLMSVSMDNPPDGKPDDSIGGDNDPRTLETSVYFDQSAFERTGKAHPAIGKAFENLGYQVTKDEKALEGTVPSTERVNTVMDYLREQTGFAPTLAEFDGDFFSGEEMVEAISNDEVLVGMGVRARSHDMFNHNTAWLFLPEETFRAIGSRGKQLLDARRSFGDQLGPEPTIAKSNLSKHLSKLEGEIEIQMIRGLAEYLENPDAENSWTAQQLYELTHNEYMDAPEKTEIGNQLAKQMAKRILIAADMPVDKLPEKPEFN